MGMAERPVIGIVGAGLVGPVLALYLARRGYEVQLFERGPDPSDGPPTGGRSVHLVVSARGFRALAGATDPTVALPGTIRGDLGRDWGLAVQQNIVHGSDSPESAAREIGIWFPSL